MVCAGPQGPAWKDKPLADTAHRGPAHRGSANVDEVRALLARGHSIAGGVTQRGAVQIPIQCFSAARCQIWTRGRPKIVRNCQNDAKHCQASPN